MQFRLRIEELLERSHLVVSPRELYLDPSVVHGLLRGLEGKSETIVFLLL